MKTFRIGIVGVENSHAATFASQINLPDENGNLRYPDCKVTMVYGHYPEANQKMADDFGVTIARDLQEMVENVDAVMVTARDGKFHYEFARPFVEAGLPAFVDKPFTVDPKQAESLIALAKEKNVPLYGGSSLKLSTTIAELKSFVETAENGVLGGDLAAPVLMNSEYSGFFFYSSHLAEMTMETFGYNPERITATRTASGVTAIIEYDRYTVTNHFNDEVWLYSATVYGKEQAKQPPVNTDGIGERECALFVEMLRTGKMPCTYDQLLMPVYYLNAVKEAYETGKTVDILGQ